MKKTYFLFVFLVVVFFALVILVISSGSLFPTQSNVPSPDNPVFKGDVDEDPEQEKGAEVSLLIDKLPYQGANFSMSYDFNDGTFYVYINPTNTLAGNTEFDKFLEENNIDDSSQIAGLKTSSTPVPTSAL